MNPLQQMAFLLQVQPPCGLLWCTIRDFGRLPIGCREKNNLADIPQKWKNDGDHETGTDAAAEGKAWLECVFGIALSGFTVRDILGQYFNTS